METGTLKVTPITAGQPQPACRFKINCLIDGFSVELEGEGKAGDLRAIVDRLKAIGATPPSSPAAGSTPALAASSEDAPICEFHGKMKRGNYGWFCPKKMGDGSYCKSKA